MMVLGVDPGSRVTGYGLVEERGRELHYVASGVIRPAGSLAVRLHRIHQELLQIIALHAPGEAAVEEVFLARNFKSSLALGEARGVALLAAAGCGLEVFEYSALEVKKAVVGYGHAGKEQVRAMIVRLLALAPEEVPRTDASDALAVAICHLNSRRLAFLATGKGTPR
ncbi:MAG: crossover junction endodeoxyribonuclease RuvC [Pseudomonadota bacterium]